MPSKKHWASILLVGGLILLFPYPVEAYLGPGAEFAFISSFFIVFSGLFSSLPDSADLAFSVAIGNYSGTLIGE